MRLLVVIGAVAIVAGFLVGGSQAAFTDAERATQSLTVGTAPDPPDPPPPLRFQARRYDVDDRDGQIQPGLRVVNDGDVPVDLTTVTVRYWFSNDGAAGQLGAYCYYATLGCAPYGSAAPSVQEEVPARVGGDRYLELRFTAGTLEPGAHSGDAQLAVRTADGSILDETNDHSRTTSTTYEDSQVITGYVDGVLVWGELPPPLPSGVTVQVRYSNLDQGQLPQSINPGLDILNTGDRPLDLTRLTVRYWFTRDGSDASTVHSWCDYAYLGCSTVKHAARVLDPPRPGGDMVLEVGFAAGSIGVSNATGPIMLRLGQDLGAAFDETDDHSYGTNAPYLVWTKVTAYVDGQLVWGIEPT